MTWTEQDSESFLDDGAYYVPERELQVRTICDLIPASDQAMHLVELCCGEGLLSQALLACFPKATVHAYDGSPTMLRAARDRAGADADRLETHLFDLNAADWRDFAVAPQAVVSSLAVHHLEHPAKQRLFADLARGLTPGGRFILADLIEPTTPESRSVAAAAWDDAVERRALEIDGHRGAFERFRDTNWNLYSDPEPDPVDKPAAVFDLMKWFEAGGFRSVDLHWMKAGHVIISGVAPG